MQWRNPRDWNFRRIRKWQIIGVIALVLGYGAYELRSRSGPDSPATLCIGASVYYHAGNLNPKTQRLVGYAIMQRTKQLTGGASPAAVCNTVKVKAAYMRDGKEGIATSPTSGPWCVQYKWARQWLRLVPFIGCNPEQEAWWDAALDASRDVYQGNWQPEERYRCIERYRPVNPPMSPLNYLAFKRDFDLVLEAEGIRLWCRKGPKAEGRRSR